MGNIRGQIWEIIFRGYFVAVIIGHVVASKLGGPEWMVLSDGSIFAAVAALLVMAYVDHRITKLERKWDMDPDKTKVEIEISD